MALTVDEQELLDFALAALPHWFQDDERPTEGLGAYAKMIGQAKTQGAFWQTQTLITQAVGAIPGSEPDWLNQHAADRGTGRQAAETDPALRDRIRNVPDALTRPTILSAAQSIVDAESIVGTVRMVELRQDRGFFRAAVSDSGTGGTFSGTAPDMEFVPDSPGFAAPPFRTIEEDVGHRLVISGALSAANNGTFAVTGLSDDKAQYQNATGVAGADATVSWTIEKLDRDGNLLDGFRDSYFSRGDRFGMDRAEVILILPFGCTPGTQSSTLEMLRQKRGAGVIAVAECMDGLAYPQTVATLRTALGLSGVGTADSIWDFDETSGPVLDHAPGGSSLTPTGSPTQGVDSEVMGTKVMVFTEASTDSADAPSSAVHNVTTGSVAVLGVFRCPVPPAAPVQLLSKRDAGPGAGYSVELTSSRLRFVVEDTGATVNIADVIKDFCDGRLHAFIGLRDATGSTVDLFTTLGDGTVAETVLSLTNTSIFSVGEGLWPAFGGDVAYVAVFTGSDAEALGAAQLSAFHASLGLGAI